jgi:two-component system sensor histidine kinase CpxA
MQVPEIAIFIPMDVRVENARDRQSGGVGLGLVITDRAVRFHGGEVIATNAPDGGLLMKILLPLTEPPSTAERN